jgi:hypothetical protein
VEGLIMNALEQEYRDNVATSSVREKRRIFILGAIGCAIGGTACAWIAPDKALIFAVLTGTNIAGAIVSRRLVVPASAPVEEEKQAALGYRDAVLPQSSQPVAPKNNVSSLVFRAIMVLAFFVAFVCFGWGHVSSRLVAYVLTGIGFLLVVAIKGLHNVWKKRRDAKLMLEWERRLEEMK